MADNKIVARVQQQEDGTTLVCSPGVGVVDAVPDKGIYLNPMGCFLRLKVLNHWQQVLLPHNVKGWIAERFVEDTHHPVEYNQPLVRLTAGMDAPGERLGAVGEQGGELQDQGLIKVSAPSEGIFYRRPGPDSPSYVELGDEVITGTVLGLVEVMKSFNQILYGGPGFPERGTVARIGAEDSAEVQFDQMLFLIKPE